MNPPEESALAEKARLQQQYAASQQQKQLEPPGPHSPTSASGSSANVVPSSYAETELNGDYNYDERARGSTPPPYSGTNLPVRPQPKGPQKYPGLPQLDYRLYQPPLFELLADRTSIRSSAPYLSANATALVSLIRAQSTVPPKPQIHITGKRGHNKIDFAIKLNLMNLLVPDDPRQRMDYIRCVGENEMAFRGGLKPSAGPNIGDGGLEEWARTFVEDAGGVKSFMLERIVANLDIGWLEGQIRSLIATMAYKGVVTVSFPVTHAKVVVQNPDKVNKFFTSVTTVFTGKKKYEVAKAVWPFATHKNGEPGRKCVVQSEETWWLEWRDSIRYAVATKRHGWVTNEDKLEAIMEGVGKGVSSVDWGPEH